MLQEVARKKVLKPSRRGPAVEYLCDPYRVSERHACSVLRVPRATYRYRSCANLHTDLRMRIRELARARGQVSRLVTVIHQHTGTAIHLRRLHGDRKPSPCVSLLAYRY